jgi:hypothetical protein
MADLYSTTVGSTTFGSNALKLDLDKGQTFSATNPLTDVGTPQLQIIKFSVADANISTTPTISNSLLSQLIRVVQPFGEIYSVGAFTNANPSVGIMIFKKDTLNGAEANSNVQAATFGAMEAAVVAGVTGASAATIAEASLTGLTIS